VNQANKLGLHLEDLAKSDKVLQTKDFFGAYTLDIICSCCFGIEVNSLNDPDNEFIKNVTRANKINLKDPRLLLLFLFPKFTKFLYTRNLIKLNDKEAFAYLTDITNQVIERRKSKQEVREDFIQHMIEIEENEKINENADNKSDNIMSLKLKKTLTSSEIVSSAVLFMAAGFETTANTLCFISYCLALNQDVQDKLCQEIDDVLEKHDGKVTYDSVSEMKYMDMVIDETQRLYPAATRLDRVANQDYEFEGIKLQKGQIWACSIVGVHYDEETYPNPKKFDPERFNDKNKATRDQMTHLPFGAGPRNCIAIRFALLEMKILLATLLSKSKFVKCDETDDDVKLDFATPGSAPVTQIKLRVTSRF
jgi:cytochrome P450